MDERIRRRWDGFTLHELTAMVEAMEAACFSDAKVHVPLWLELLDVMDDRGVGIEREREVMRVSVQEARRPLSTCITMVDGRPPYHSMRKGT